MLDLVVGFGGCLFKLFFCWFGYWFRLGMIGWFSWLGEWCCLSRDIRCLLGVVLYISLVSGCGIDVGD